MKLHDTLNEIATYDHFLSKARLKLDRDWIEFYEQPESELDFALDDKQFAALKKYFPKAVIVFKQDPRTGIATLMSAHEREIKVLHEKIAELSKALNDATARTTIC